MTDPRITKLADLLANYCVACQPGERVMLRGSTAALPLVEETMKAVLNAGAHPFIMWEDDRFNEILLKEGNADQVSYIHEPHLHMMEHYDCLISCRGAENTRQLSGVELSQQQLMRKSRQKLFKPMMKRAAAGELRWVGTLFPTAAHAQDADMSLAEFSDFVYGACFVDRPDPVAEWRAFSQRQQKLVDYLKGKSDVRVQGPNVDLTLSIKERTFINSDGKRNMPSGEIFTGPVENSVNGWVRFTYPAIVNGREVEGIELSFKEGKVVEASAVKNDEFLQTVLNTDEGARYLGEFAIGTNDGIQRFTKSILYDEKIGGTIHMAVGAGYPETGSVNQSAVHWDMICDMRDGGQIWIDDELFYESGRFVSEQ